MLHAFGYDEVGVIVRHWFEIDLNDSHLEHGARVELRLLAPEERHGSESAAQRIHLDRPLWRADLFDRLDGAPGNFAAAHYHPYFREMEPSERHWAEEIQADAWGWLEAQLSDVAGLAARGGTPLARPEAETAGVRPDVSAIVAAAQRRAAVECGSKEQCYAWTSDVTGAVDVMLDRLERPELLDKQRLSPWLAA